MELDLNAIRKVFPDWPSALDVARSAGNWLAMASAFNSAAYLLHDAYLQGTSRLESGVGKPVECNAVRGFQVSGVAVFCLAFSIELAIKAARVKQGDLAHHTSGDQLPFHSHNLVGIASRVRNSNLSPEEHACLEKCAAIIASGKYPVGTCPDGSTNGVPPSVRFEEFSSIAEQLYQHFARLAS